MSTMLIARDACPWCGGTESVERCAVSYRDHALIAWLEAFYNRQGCFEGELIAEGYFRLEECLRCGLVYQIEIPNIQLAERLYSIWIDPRKSFEVYEARKSIAYYEPRALGIIAGVKWLRRDPCDLAVLDYSMGWAQWARIGAALGLKMSGTEYIAAKREYAKSLGIVVADEDALPSESFDWVNADQVLEHVPDPRAVFERLCDWVRPGGIISLSVPYGGDVMNRLAALDWNADKNSPNSLMPVQPLEHINCFRREHISRGLLEQGFSEIVFEQPSLLVFGYRRTRRFAGDLVRKVMGRKRPPLTIDVVAVKSR